MSGVRPLRARCRWLFALLALAAALAVACPAALAKGRDDWQQPDRVMADMNFRPGAAVADIGCGKGYFTFRIARAVGEQGKVFAVDIDESALAAVRKRAQRENVRNIEIVHSQPTDTTLKPACADAALLCNVLHHVPQEQRQELVRSIARSLKPGGYLFVIDLRKVHNPPFHTYDQLVAREEVLNLAKNAGLELDAEWYYLSYQYFLRFRKPEKSSAEQ